MAGILTRLVETSEEPRSEAVPRRASGWSWLPVLLAATVLLTYVVYALVQNDTPPPEKVGTPVLAHWDGEWYLDIAEHGYRGEGGTTNPEFRPEFFPLFPGLAAGIHAVLPFVSLDAVGVTLNVLFTLLAIALVDRMASGWPLYQRCMLALFLVTIPNAFFFVCFYGEAMLAFCAAVVIWGLRSPNRLLSAAAGAALGALTRPVGFLLAVPVVLTALARPRERSSMAAVGIAGSGLAVLFLVCEALAGSPIAFVHAQFSNPEWRDWALGRHGFGGAWRTVEDAFFGPGFERFGSQPVGVIMLVLAVAFSLMAWRWDRRFSIGALLLVLGPLWFQPLSALARYLVPTWFAWVGGIAAIRHRRAGVAAVSLLCVAGFACNIALLDRFSRWVFVG